MNRQLATVTEFSVPAIRTEADLIAAINGEHERAILAVRRGIEHARQAGELLIRAKSICIHGCWTPWLTKNIAFSTRTAENYMRLAANWHELEAKTLPVADLTLRQAIAALTVSKSAEPHRGREDNLTLPGVTEAPPPALPDLSLTVPALGAPAATTEEEEIDEHECPFCGSMTKRDSLYFWLDVSNSLNRLWNSAVGKYRDIGMMHGAVNHLRSAFSDALKKANARYQRESAEQRKKWQEEKLRREEQLRREAA